MATNLVWAVSVTICWSSGINGQEVLKVSKRNLKYYWSDNKMFILVFAFPMFPLPTRLLTSQFKSVFPVNSGGTHVIIWYALPFTSWRVRSHPTLDIITLQARRWSRKCCSCFCCFAVSSSSCLTWVREWLLVGMCSESRGCLQVLGVSFIIKEIFIYL